MNSTKKSTLYIVVMISNLMPFTSFSGLNWMPSNYWLAGYMYIAGPDDLTYNIYDATSKTLSPIDLKTNTAFNIRDFYAQGNMDRTPRMDDTTKILFVPNKTFIPNVADSAADQLKKSQQFEKDLRAGRDYPYIVVERNQGIINIFIVGPTRFLPSLSKKLGFNFLAFEQLWVKPSYWYNHLDDHSPGMAFAFSFDATQGTFLNSPGKILSDDAFYIIGLRNKSWPLGWSWTYQGPENTVIKGMTAQKLVTQGIIEYQQPVISLRELQRIIDFINSTGQGKFDNVL